MDLVFNLNSSVTYLDVSIVAPFPCNPSSGLSSQHPTRTHVPKELKRGKVDRHPHINLAPLMLETPGRPGPQARKFISTLMRDASHQGHLVSYPKCAPQCHLKNNNSQPPLRDLRRSLPFTVSLLLTSCWLMLVLFKRERTQRFQSQANRSRAMWPCCDYTSSDDDGHNTDNNRLLLFADGDYCAGSYPRLMCST